MEQRYQVPAAVGHKDPSDRSETGQRYQFEQSAFHRSHMDREAGERPDMGGHFRGPGRQPYGDRFGDVQQRPLDERPKQPLTQQYDRESAVGRQEGLGDRQLEMSRDHMRGAPGEVPPQSRFPQQQGADNRNLAHGQSNQDAAHPNYRPDHQSVRPVDEKPRKTSPFFTTQQPQTQSQPVVHQVKKGPPAYQIPAILSCICCPCWCLGAAAIWFSMKTQERRYQGDMNGAKKASDRTKILIVVAVIVGILAWIIIVLSSIFGR